MRRQSRDQGYEAGSQPPEGYLAWHSWADAQHKGGLRQERCCVCGLWRYPQEFSGKTRVTYPEKSDGTKVRLVGKICNKCGHAGN